LRILRDEVLVQSVTLAHFFVAQTITISIATGGDFSLDLGFSCFIWDSGLLLKIWVCLILVKV